MGWYTLDADNKELKEEFVDYIKDDILNNRANELAEDATSRLESAGYKGQIFPREINFFWMEDGIRERIVNEGGKFNVLNTDLSFSSEEIEKLAVESPEKFSPNVVMRPLYQEVILPNLAYIGGPAEMAYWLEKSSANVDFESRSVSSM